jgi:hypothetical protein
VATKLFCYVDESGQDTHGELFIVSVVVSDDQVEELHTLCEELETTSTKGKTKWGRSETKRRLEYMRLILNEPRFEGCLRYSVFRNRDDYDLATIDGIALTLRSKNLEPGDKAKIYVDALAKTKRHEYGAALRKLGLRGHEIKSISRDENDALIRLADAVAGFVRDAITGESKRVHDLFDQGLNNNILVSIYEDEE